MSVGALLQPRQAMVVRRWIELGLPLALFGACDRPETSSKKDDNNAPRPSPNKSAPDEVPNPYPSVESTPLDRSERPFTYLARGSDRFGFRIAGLPKLRALEGTIDIPAWSVTGSGDPKPVRDDDLLTGWLCKPEATKGCAIGLHFPAQVEVHALRLFAAAGPSSELFEQHPRPSKLRIHTDEGFIDVNVLDQRDFAYALLSNPVTTTELTVEITDAFLGRDETAPLLISDLEVYGEGPSRPPFVLDPDTVYAEYDRQGPWKRRGDLFDAQPSFLFHVDADGNTHGFLPGSAVQGHKDDRLLLVERLENATTCDSGQATYALFDRETRILAPLGALGGIGGDFFRRTDGLGFALGAVSDYTTELKGVSLIDDRYVRKHTPVRPDLQSTHTLSEWELDPSPIPRQAPTLSDTDLCSPVDEDMLSKLSTAKKDRKRRRESDPSEWRVCPVGAGANLFVTDRGECGVRWELHLVDQDWNLIDSETGSPKDALLRVRQLHPGLWLFEGSGANDQSSVYRVTPSSIDVLADSGAFATPLPSSCRTPCSQAFPNPHHTSWSPSSNRGLRNIP